jgi:excisionase family DNA binding protein
MTEKMTDKKFYPQNGEQKKIFSNFFEVEKVSGTCQRRGALTRPSGDIQKGSDDLKTENSPDRDFSESALLTLEQVRILLNVSLSTIERLVRNQQLPIIKIAGCRRVDPVDLEKFKRRNRSR